MRPEHSKSAKEVEELWSYINDRLERNFRRTVFSAPGSFTQAAMPRSGASGGFGRRVTQ